MGFHTKEYEILPIFGVEKANYDFRWVVFSDVKFLAKHIKIQ